MTDRRSTPFSTIAAPALLLLMLSALLFSQGQPPIATDRPGFGTGATTVAPGAVQIESGLQIDYPDDNTTVLTAPLAVIRTGLSERLEVNLAYPGWIRVDNGGSSTARSDLSLGGKLRLDRRGLLRTTLFGAATLPVGEDGATSDQVDGLAGLAAEYQAGPGLGLSVSVQGGSAAGPDGRTGNGQVAVGITTSNSDRLSSFVEYAATGLFGDLSTGQFLDAGFTFLAAPNVQLDISGGLGLTNASADFVSLGLSVRLPE